MAISDIPTDLKKLYEIHEWRHASAVLMKDFPKEWQDICEGLRKFRLVKSRIAVPGGSKSLISKALEKPLNKLGWAEKHFETSITVDLLTEESPTHKVDCFKNKVGLEIEWNNKDPFFDRDLNNFRLLFDLRALSVGVIVTRCDELQSIFNRIGRGSSYGNSTTHMGKLLPRLKGGAGGGCPILVFGIREALLDDDISDSDIKQLQREYAEGKKSGWKVMGTLLSKYFPVDELKKFQGPEEEE
jgi:Restriction endonuclease BglII